MAQAATKQDVHPRSMSSFNGAVQSLEAFQQLNAFSCEHDHAQRKHIYENLLNAVASHRVANRTGRFEPRKIKRRHGSYDWLKKPRREEQRELLQGLKTK